MASELELKTRVFITQQQLDSGKTIFMAQALEVDYFAEAYSLQDLKDNFERGLVATAAIHLLKYQSLKRLQVPAPPHVWQEFHEMVSSGMAVADKARRVKAVGDDTKKARERLGKIQYIQAQQ